MEKFNWKLFWRLLLTYQLHFRVFIKTFSAEAKGRKKKAKWGLQKGAQMLENVVNVFVVAAAAVVTGKKCCFPSVNAEVKSKNFNTT